MHLQPTVPLIHRNDLCIKKLSGPWRALLSTPLTEIKRQRAWPLIFQAFLLTVSSVTANNRGRGILAGAMKVFCSAIWSWKPASANASVKILNCPTLSHWTYRNCTRVCELVRRWVAVCLWLSDIGGKACQQIFSELIVWQETGAGSSMTCMYQWFCCRHVCTVKNVWVVSQAHHVMESGCWDGCTRHRNRMWVRRQLRRTQLALSDC